MIFNVKIKYKKFFVMKEIFEFPSSLDLYQMNKFSFKVY
jgi:hypothetical protein